MADPKKEQPVPEEPITQEMEVVEDEEPLKAESPTGNYRIATEALQALLEGKKVVTSSAQNLVKRITASTPKKKAR